MREVDLGGGVKWEKVRAVNYTMQEGRTLYLGGLVRVDYVHGPKYVHNH